MTPTPEVVATAKDLGILRFVDGSPLVDSRGFLGSHEGRSLLVDLLTPHVYEYGAKVIVGGVANSGAVLGVLLADRLTGNFVNVLVDGPRSRGLQRQLEPEDALGGRRVLLVDNWASSGNSLIEAARLVQMAGGVVTGALLISANPDFCAETFPIPTHLGIPLECLTKVRDPRRATP